MLQVVENAQLRSRLLRIQKRRSDTRERFVLAYTHIQRAGRETRRRDIVQSFFAVSVPHAGAGARDKRNMLPLRLILLLAMQQPVAGWPSLLSDTPRGVSWHLSPLHCPFPAGAPGTHRQESSSASSLQQKDQHHSSVPQQERQSHTSHYQG